MPITNINRYFVGDPNIVGIVTTDSLADITTPEYYLDQADAIDLIQHGEFQFTDTDLVLIFYSDGIGFFTYDPTTQAFVANGTPGEVILPVVTGNFANWANTTGGLEDLGFHPTDSSLGSVAMVNKLVTINTGDVPAFMDGTGSVGKLADGSAYALNGTLQTRNAIYCSSGGFVAYSTTSAGYFAHACQPSLIHGMIITNPTALAQDSTCYLPDPGAAAATIPVIVQHPVTITPGHLIAAGTTAGTLVDGGALGTAIVSTSGVSTMQAASEIVFDHTTPQTLVADAVTINKQGGIIQTGTLNTASGATYTFTLNNSWLTSGSNVQLTLQYGDNTTTNVECVMLAPPGSGSVQISLINNNAAALNGNMKIYFFIPY